MYRAAAVPEGSVRAPGQLLWLAAVRAVPEFAELREDALRGVLAIAEALAQHADWSTMLSRPTHHVLAERAGVSRRRVARVRSRLQAAGLVGIVTPGRTSDPVDPDAGPLAQAYVLTIPRAVLAQLQPSPRPHGEDQADDVPPDVGEACPAPPVATGPASLTRPGTPVDETVTPSRVTFGDSGEEPPYAREALERARCARGTTINCDLDGEWLGREIIWPTTLRPVTRLERHLAAAEARRIDPILRRVSTPHVAALAREWHLKGWTIADVRWALVHRPDGSIWPHSLVEADVRHVPGWVRHRMAAWRTDPNDPTSPPRLSRSQRIEDARAKTAAEHAATAAEHAATAAAALPVAQVPDWDAARARLAARTAAAAAARRHQEQQATTTGADPVGPADDPPDAPVTRAAVPPAPTEPPVEPAGHRRRPRAGGGGRPVNEAADPRIAALRAAARARRRPRA